MSIRVALAAALCATYAASAAAQAPPSGSLVASQGRPAVPSPITDRFHLRGSYFAPSVETDLRLDARDGTPGTPLTAEGDLGLDDRADQGRLELMIRMRERGRMRVDYFKLDRYAQRLLERTIDFGDETFLAGEQVATSIDWRMLGFTYTYSALRLDRVELGIGLGIHLLEAEARGEVRARQQREEAAGAGAFPTGALDFAWRISRRFSLTARGQYFSTSVEEFDGTLAEYHADVQYRWKPNFAIGLGYTAIRAELNISDDDFPGRFELDVSGPELFFRVSF